MFALILYYPSSGKRRFKDELFTQFARIGMALSSGCRLELLELLAQGERSVEVLTLETGSLSVPVTELRARVKEVPKKRLLVAYCRGPYCVFADHAVEQLRAAGYRAFRLEGGFLEWHAQ